MNPADVSFFAIAICALAFLAGGTAKGAIGAGLPAVAVPIMVVAIEPAPAIALTVVPVALANVWQAVQGGHYRTALRSYWPFLLAFAAGVTYGAQVLVTLNPRTMALAIGLLVIASTLLQWRVQRLAIPDHMAGWLNPVAGMVCGVIGGATAVFVPVVVYLAALRLPKDMFVAQMALSMMFGSVPLYATLAVNQVLTWTELALSAAAFAPVAAGLVAGKWVRDRLSQETFEQILLSAMFLLGLALIAKGLR